jgi:thioredoxin-related protein
MFRKISIILLLVAACFDSFSQGAAATKKIAPFSMRLTNGQQFNYSQLAAGPVVLIYFSPDCDHCQDFTKDLVKNYNVVANKQVVMVTFQAMDMLKPFVTQYGLNAYTNFKVGTEGTSYVVQKYYQIRSFPYIAIYDKKGNLVRTFEGEQPHAEIFKALRSI